MTAPQLSSIDYSIPVNFEGSPYRFKQLDPYSSHSLILSHLGRADGARVLDVGSAYGYLAAALRIRGCRVTGIDVDSALARQAATYCDEVFETDLDIAVPPLKGSFDYIVYGDVLEHLKYPLAVLQNLNAHLKSDGRVIISVPNVANLYVRLHLLRGRFDYQNCGLLDRTHLRFFTLTTFRQLLEQADLEILEINATPIPLPLVVPAGLHGRLLKGIHSLNAWLARSWRTMFGYQFVALARKEGSR